MSVTISTQRLTLLNCDELLLHKILEGNTALAGHLNISIPEKWNEFGLPSFKYALERLQENRESGKWWTYLIILQSPATLIGDCGYKGIPNEEGMVEIGYEIAEVFRNKGYATEAVQALIEHAFSHSDVATIYAHTLAEENASNKILQKTGFEYIKELDDPEDGKIWRWRLNREALNKKAEHH